MEDPHETEAVEFGGRVEEGRGGPAPRLPEEIRRRAGRYGLDPHDLIVRLS